MKWNQLFFSTILAFLMFSCSKDTDYHIDESDCAMMEGKRIISEEERDTTCIYENVYALKSKIYFHCQCCLCLKLASPLDCEGNGLEDFDHKVLHEFLKEALYLFSVVDN